MPCESKYPVVEVSFRGCILLGRDVCGFEVQDVGYTSISVQSLRNCLSSQKLVIAGELQVGLLLYHGSLWLQPYLGQL